jgi:hypothetical protein
VLAAHERFGFQLADRRIRSPCEPAQGEGPGQRRGAIYGQILVTSFVAALSEVADVDAGEIFASLLATMLVFWLAHVYADAVAQRLEREDPLTWREVWNIAKYEWPGLQAAVPALVALSLSLGGSAVDTHGRPRGARARSGGATRLGLSHRLRLAAVCARDPWIGRPQRDRPCRRRARADASGGLEASVGFDPREEQALGPPWTGRDQPLTRNDSVRRCLCLTHAP